jgi:hypothetical protein
MLLVLSLFFGFLRTLVLASCSLIGSYAILAIVNSFLGTGDKWSRPSF